MLAGLRIETWVLLAVTLGNLLLYIDRWVHRQEAVAQKIDGEASLKVRFETAEALRIERAATIEHRLHLLDEEIQRLHEKASDYGSILTEAVGNASVRLTKVEAQTAELFRMSERRK